MNGDPFRYTTREEIERVFGADLDLDEENHVEEMQQSEGRVIAWLLLSIAIVLASLIGLAGCTETVERESYAPLTSIRPEARP
jgi:hypothetical protein